MAAAPIGTAYVVVRALTAGLKKDIEEGVRDASRSPEVNRAGEGIGRSLGRGMAKGADREMNSSRGFATVFRTLGRVASAAMTGLKFTALGSLGALAGAGAVNVLSLIGSLQSLIGVAGLLPAVLGSMVGLFATLKIGFSGFGEALKNMGDPKAFAEAIKKLAPAAQEAAIAVRGLRKSFKDLKLDVQEKLFKGLGETIKEVGTKYMPLLKKGFGEIAVAANAGFKQIGRALVDPKTMTAMSQLLTNTAKATTPLFAGLGSVFSAFTKIAAVGSEFLKPFADSFASAASRFNSFIDRVTKSGELKAWIQAGIDAFKQLWSVIASIGSILGSIFSAAEQAGGSTLATLSEHLKTIADIVAGPAFQGGLVAFFSGINKGADAVARAFPAIADALVALGPLFGAIALNLGPIFADVLILVAGVIERLAPALVPIVNTIGPAFMAIIRSMTPILFQLADALVPIIGLIGQGLAAAFTFLVPLIAKALPYLTPLIELLGNALVAALTWLIPKIGEVVTWLGTFFTSVGDGTSKLQPFINWVTGTFLPAVQSIWTALQTAYTVVAPIVAEMAALFMSKWPQISAIVQQVFSTIGTIISAVMTNIKIVITVVTTVIAGIWALWGDTIKGFVSRAFDAIASIIRGVLNIIQGIIRTVLAVIKGDWSGAWNGIKQVLTGVWQVIKGVVMTGINAAKTLISGGVAFIKAAWSAGWNAVKAAFSAAWNGIMSLLRAGISTARSIMSSIINGIISVARGAISSLTGIGRSIVDGLVSGIRAGFGAVQAAARSIVDAIPGPIRKLMGIASPSKVMIKIGAQIAEGLVVGLDQATRSVKGAVSGMGDAVSGAFDAAGVTKQATGLGADVFRQSGIDAASAFISGVESQASRIEAAMLKVAKSMGDAITKAFGGGYTGTANGLGSMTSAAASGRRLIPASAASAVAGVTGATTVVRGTGDTRFRDINVTISVDDLGKMTKVGEFLDMLDAARQTNRMTARSGTVTR